MLLIIPYVLSGIIYKKSFFMKNIYNIYMAEINETISTTEQEKKVEETNSSSQPIKEEPKETNKGNDEVLTLKQELDRLKQELYNKELKVETEKAKQELLKAGAKPESLDYLITKYGTKPNVAEITNKESFLFGTNEVVVEKPKKLTAAEIKRLITGR